jgi:hypothetical protein
MTGKRPLRAGRPAGRRARTLILAVLLAGTVAGLGPASASAEPASAACHAWTGAPPPSPGTGDNTLNSVAVLSPCDAWAVGFDQDSGGLDQTLTEHWDGSAWTVVPSPDVAGLDNILNGVRAESPTDIWAVGESAAGISATGENVAGISAATGGAQPLILHWNGHTWAQVASPSPGTAAVLQAVRTVSATDAWAVGSVAHGTTGQPLILRWNGHTWAQTASPHPGANGGLASVAAISASNAWAVGTFFNGTANRSLILHWNGQKWAQVPSPNPSGPARNTFLNGVAAGSASGKAWAVGFYDNGTTDKTLVLAWNGKTWAQQATPSLGISVLEAAATIGADNTWAVGVYDSGTARNSLILHWNGTAWARVASPNPGSFNFLDAVGASSASNVWAVGQFTAGSNGTDQNFAIHCC